jgi:hypothetical protein
MPRALDEIDIPVSLVEAVGEEVLEWYFLSPQERWQESLRLWETFRLLGGSLDREPDSQSPFDFSRETGERPPDGRPGLHSLRRG